MYTRRAGRKKRRAKLGKTEMITTMKSFVTSDLYAVQKFREITEKKGTLEFLYYYYYFFVQRHTKISMLWEYKRRVVYL